MYYTPVMPACQEKVVYPMKGRSFLKLLDLTNEEIGSLLDLAAENLKITQTMEVSEV